MTKIVDIETEHTFEIKTLFEVLKENLNEVKIDFMKDPNNGTNKRKSKREMKKNKKNSKDSDDENDDDDDNDNNNDNDSNNNTDADSDNEQNDENDDDNNDKTSDKDSDSSSDDSDQDDEKPKSKDDTIDKNKSKDKEIDGGIRIMALDDRETLLIYVKLESSNFVRFYVKPHIHSVGLDLLEFHKFMKTVDKESVMKIFIDKDDEQSLQFELRNEIKHNSKKYKQKLMDIDDNSNQLPADANFEMSVIMDTVDFRKACSEINQFSEYVEITCTSKKITFKCKGDQSDFSVSYDNSSSGVRILSLNKNTKVPCIVQAIYDLKHLVTFGKCVNLCSEMQIYLKNDFPLFIRYNIGSLGKMLIGLSPIDSKTIKKDMNYDDKMDGFYKQKSVVAKD